METTFLTESQALTGERDLGESLVRLISQIRKLEPEKKSDSCKVTPLDEAELRRGWVYPHSAQCPSVPLSTPSHCPCSCFSHWAWQPWGECLHHPDKPTPT